MRRPRAAHPRRSSPLTHHISVSWLTANAANAANAAIAAVLFPASALANAPDKVPPGAYKDSCKDVSASGGHLIATCKNAVGQWVGASYENPYLCLDMANVHGVLTCTNRIPLCEYKIDETYVKCNASCVNSLPCHDGCNATWKTAQKTCAGYKWLPNPYPYY